MQITILKKASNTKDIITVHNSELRSTLLEFLLSKQYPMAYSCRGEGICQKCIVSDSILSCLTTVEKVINKEITINYL